MRPPSLSLAAILLLAASGCSRQPNDPLAPVRQHIRNEIAQRAPSISIGVFQGDHVIWEEAFGWANRERHIRATPETTYSLGSLSKPITATAIMVLRDRGLIDLDRPVNDYLGEPKLMARVGNASDATVKRVAQHDAGLPGYYESFYPDEPGKPPAMKDVIQHYGFLMFPPGERFYYSNLDYGVLGEAIAHASGESYDSFVRNEVFLPLGMKDSCVTTCPELKDREATRYRNGSPIADYTTPHPPASDDYSTVPDLLRFAKLHMGIRGADERPILSDASIEQMRTQTVPAGSFSYGIGWVVTGDRASHLRVGHGGGGAGVDAQLTFVPDEKLAVAVLVNTFDEADRHIAGQLADEVLDALSNNHPRGSWLAAWDSLKGRVFRDSFHPAATLAGRWTGVVRTESNDLPITIWFNSSGDVQFQLSNQQKTSLKNPRFESGMFTGVSPTEIATPEATRRHHSLEFDLVPRGEVLNGTLYAVGTPDSRGVMLGYWTELRRRP